MMDGWVPELPASGQSWWRVDEVFGLEAVARRWLGKLKVLTKEEHEGICLVAITCNPLF